MYIVYYTIYIIKYNRRHIIEFYYYYYYSEVYAVDRDPTIIYFFYLITMSYHMAKWLKYHKYLF